MDAFEIGGSHRGYQVADDCITIFLNFKEIARIKSRSEAVGVINRLIKGCPPEFHKDLEEQKELLFRNFAG